MARKARAKAKAPALARLGDPLVLADGRVVQPERFVDKAKIDDTPIQSPVEYRPPVQRSIRDLPAPLPMMNGVACIAVYTVLGLSDREIGEALGVSSETVERMKDNQSYSDTFRALADSFISVNSELIQARIAAYGHGALTSLAQVALHGKNEATRARWSADLLDRGGHSRKDLRGASNGESDLRIIVTKGDEVVDVNLSLGGGNG